ncbi:putative tri m 2 allergen [Diaporthe ampelina]|uniref:Putative tri m 2 allergen n=1 Tax=Diaporthe ampelina TaxID=1214573 RepID=A0A0G2FXT3_9PEZI|nr:putative tri m 2 allergen [Diaporthe ampelina]
MFGSPLLVGLWVYFILTTASPLADYARDLDASLGANNITDSRVVVTDTSANDYLTLLSAPFDVANPNPVEKGYVRDDSDGAGTTIFVIDTGFNMERFPDEECLDERRIDTSLVPRSYRAEPLTDAERNAGYYFPPDNMDDVSTPANSKNIHGHGTQVAILAGGCKTGVARKANLFLIKMVEVLMKAGLVEETMTGPNAQLHALRLIGAAVAGNVASVSVPRGKAVLVMCTGNWREENMSSYGANWEAIKTQMKMALERLDQLGVTVVMAAGNDGSSSNPQQNPDFVPRYTDQQFPQGLATVDSPMLLVGSTNSKGQLSTFSTPGRGDIPVSLYAQGEAVSTYDLQQSGPKLKSGTSYSAPIVVRSPQSELSRVLGAS